MSSGVLKYGGVLIRKAVGAALVLAMALGRTLRRDYVFQLHGPKPLEAAICFISSQFDVQRGCGSYVGRLISREHAYG